MYNNTITGNNKYRLWVINGKILKTKKIVLIRLKNLFL